MMNTSPRGDRRNPFSAISKNIGQKLKQMARSEIVAGICAGLVIGAMVFAVLNTGATSSPKVSTSSNATPALGSTRTGSVANFGGHNVSNDVRDMANWIAESRDAHGAAFVLVDKKDAKVYVFNGVAQLVAASPVLLGGAKGDDTVPGIGSRPIDSVLPDERTTPAGRFVGERGRNARGEDVVWVDYDAAVSIHRVLTTNSAEQRLERLASPTSDDNRISYGCINVPIAFYETYIHPTFASQKAVIYILPEIKTLSQVFGHAIDRNRQARPGA